MPRYTIIELAEGYTLIQTGGRFYPMTLSLKEGGVPEVSPIILDGQVISFSKRATAASYTWKHLAQSYQQSTEEVSTHEAQ